MISTPRRALAVALGASSALLLVTTPAWADGGQDGGASGSQAQGSSNPPGNNGTVKIDDSADGGSASQAPSGKDNDAHVTCDFTVSFYGFDSSQSAQLNFAGQAPTKGSGHYTTSTSWSGKSRGGGQWDATVPINASTLISDVFGSSPPAKQGCHVKLTTTIGDPNAPQGANVKHKVFWLKPCSGAHGGAVAASTQQSQSGQQASTQENEQNEAAEHNGESRTTEHEQNEATENEQNQATSNQGAEQQSSSTENESTEHESTEAQNGSTENEQNEATENESTEESGSNASTPVKMSGQTLARPGTQVAGTSLLSPTTVGTVAKATTVSGTSLARPSGSSTIPTKVLGTTLNRGPAGTNVAATSSSRTLPFTGFAGLATAGLGAGALGLGGAMTVLSRRRRRNSR